MQLTPNRSAFEQKFDAVCANAQQVAEILERGIADRPLHDCLNAMRRKGGANLTITVLVLTPNAGRRAILWLSGGKLFGVNLDTLQKAALATIRIDDDTAASNEATSGEVALFDVPSEQAGILRNTTLHLPLVVGRIVADPRLFRQAVAGSDLLLVAAETHFAMTPSAKEMVREFASAIGAAAALVLQDEIDIEQGGPATQRWWEAPDLFGPAHRSPTIMVSGADKPSPDAIFGPGAPLRASFGHPSRILALRLAIELLQRQYELRLRRLRSRVKQEARAARQLEEQARNPTTRNRLETVRADLADALAKLVDGLQENVKRSLLPESHLLQRVDQAVEGLAPQDIAREKTALNIQLAVSDEFRDAMADVVKEALRENFIDEMKVLRKALRDLQQKTEGDLSAALGTPGQLTLRLPEAGPIWNHLKQMIKVDVRYRGELPKRGVFKRIMEARTPVTLLLMSSTLVGGVVGFNPRQLPVFGGVLLLVFLGALAFTFRSWKHEDEVRISKEIERIRDQLKMELRRLLTELQREKIARFSAHLDELKREVSRRLDGLNKEMVEERMRQVERDRRDANGRIRALEATIREFEGVRSMFVGLAKACVDLEIMLAQSTQKTLEPA